MRQWPSGHRHINGPAILLHRCPQTTRRPLFMVVLCLFVVIVCPFVVVLRLFVVNLQECEQSLHIEVLVQGPWAYDTNKPTTYCPLTLAAQASPGIWLATSGPAPGFSDWSFCRLVYLSNPLFTIYVIFWPQHIIFVRLLSGVIHFKDFSICTEANSSDFIHWNESLMSLPFTCNNKCQHTSVTE